MKNIKEKQQDLSNLATVLELYRGRFLSRDQQDKLEAYEYGMKADLKKLIEDFRHRELDTKLSYMQKTINLVKGIHDKNDEDKTGEAGNRPGTAPEAKPKRTRTTRAK